LLLASPVVGWTALRTKAADGQVVATVPRHYIVRTSWVIGDSHNVIRTMLSLADRGTNPLIVNDKCNVAKLSGSYDQGDEKRPHERPHVG
jgi:hypothetical protein